MTSVTMAGLIRACIRDTDSDPQRYTLREKPRRTVIGRRLIALVMLAAGALAVLAWVAWDGRETIDAGNPRQVAQGQRLYVQYCAECHGARLEGEADWRIRKPTGELPAPPHDASGHTWHHSDEQLFAITKHGLARYAPSDYKSAMPAFVGTLSDGHIRAVIAYIKSTWPQDIQRRQSGLSRK